MLVLFFLPATYPVSLMIGTSGDDPPFSSAADHNNHFYGFEIDLMLNICKRIKADCQFTAVIASQLINALNSGKIDLAIAALIIPTQRVENPILFSLPYLPSKAQFIAQKKSNINTMEELKNKRVGIRLGTLDHGLMFKYFLLKEYNFQINLKLYLTMNDLLYGLANGQVDAVFSNAEPIKYWYTNNTQAFKLIGKSIPIGDGYAVMGKKGEETLIRHINQAILNMEKDGTYEKIYNAYFSF